MTRIAIALALALVAACGGSGGKRNLKTTGPRVAPKLDPVKPQARREFEAALRALRPRGAGGGGGGGAGGGGEGGGRVGGGATSCRRCRS